SDEPGGPLVLIEDGRVGLTTSGGPVRTFGDARLDEGRLVSLDLALPAARIRDEGLAVDLQAGGAALRTAGDHVALAFAGRFGSAAGAGLSGEAVEARLLLESPYPDTRLRRIEGPVR